MDTLAIGIVLGLSAGFAPGPLLALVISQTLRHNAVEGLKVALAPLVTDLPIILIT
ncbi:MAG: LysE family translocator, partial [Thermodesulfobacteriota bacterium]|nr:LysE family translocator [Thermodesulfobacteriota bacterium]